MHDYSQGSNIIKGLDPRPKTRSQVTSMGYRPAESSEENIATFPVPPKDAILKGTRYEVAYEPKRGGNPRKDSFS